MMRYGRIADINYTNGVAKVALDEVDIITDWATLPKALRSNRIFKIGQQVAVLYDGEDYEILNEVPGGENNQSPSWASNHAEGYEFADGTKIVYDTLTKQLTVTPIESGKVVVAGNAIVSGNQTVMGDLTAGATGIEFTKNFISSINPTIPPTDLNLMSALVVTNLLNLKADKTSVPTSVSQLSDAAQYLTTSSASATYATTSHYHVIGDITGLSSALSALVPNGRTISGLSLSSDISQSALQAALGLGSGAYSSTAYLPLAGGTLTGQLNGTDINLSGGLETRKGAVFAGQYPTFPTGIGTYVANYVSATYGARILAYDGTAYQKLSLGVLSGSNFGLELNTNGTARFLGGVGIGKTLELGALDVLGEEILRGTSAGLYLRNSLGDYASIVGYTGSAYNALDIRAMAGTGNGIYLDTAGNIGFCKVPTNKFDFNGAINATTAKLSNLTAGYLPYQTVNGLVNSNVFSNGINVGINTNHPTHDFEVNGSFYSASSMTTPERVNSAGFILLNTQNALWGLVPNNYITTSGTATDIWLYNSTLTNIFGGTGINLLTPAKIGIKTSSPEYDLDINGTLGVRGNTNIFQNIYSSNYVSESTGWRITNAGAADFRSVYADSLHAKAFVADISQALAGEDFLTKSVSKLSENFTIPAVGGTATFIVDDLQGFPATRCFVDGDYIRFREIDRSSGALNYGDIWGTIVLDTTFGSSGFLNGRQRYIFTCISNDNLSGYQIGAGAEVLDYGTSGSGVIERTVLDNAGSPYSQIKTWVSNPSISSNYTVWTRLGNLNGVTNCSGYGLYSQNVFLTGSITVGDLTKSSNYLYFSGGILTLSGTINVISASGYSNFSDKPTSLHDINSSEYTKFTYIDSSGIYTGTVTASQVLATGAFIASNISGLGTLATLNTVSISLITGLGALATKDNITANYVTDLGALATKSNIDHSYITDIGALATLNNVGLTNLNSTLISGGKIISSLIIANEVLTNALVSGTVVAGTGVIDNLTLTNATVSGVINVTGGNAATQTFVGNSIDAMLNKNGTQLLPNNWTVGTNAISFYNYNQTVSGENARVVGTNHLGQSVVLWECLPSGDGNADGGWNSDAFAIDPTKTYRFSVFVKKSDVNGAFYLGCGENSVCNLNTSTQNDNPYFYYSDLSGLNGYGKWYLVIGYVYPAGVTGLSNNGELWDCAAGQKISSSLTCFNWYSGATTTTHRSYLYYCSSSSTRQYMYAPRVDLVDGNEPSVAQLLGMSAIQSYSDSTQLSAQNNLANKLGYTDYSTMVTSVASAGTIISGGYINTNLLAAQSILAEKILTTTITSLGAVTAGSFNLGSGKFQVDTSGYLTATGATITGEINASTGTLGVLTMNTNGGINLPPTWGGQAGKIDNLGVHLAHKVNEVSQAIDWWDEQGGFIGRIHALITNHWLSIGSNYGVTIGNSGQGEPVYIGTDALSSGGIKIGNEYNTVDFNNSFITNVKGVVYYASNTISLTGSNATLYTSGASLIIITSNSSSSNSIYRIYKGSGVTPVNGSDLEIINTTDTAFDLRSPNEVAGSNIRTGNETNFTVFKYSIVKMKYYNGYWYCHTDHGQ